MTATTPPQDRWSCPCGASGWWTPSIHIGPPPTAAHDRPNGRRCTVARAASGTRRHLTCCTCGERAGHWHQHPNRDTGYGLCVHCARWLRDVRKMSSTEMVDLYGVPGVNYEAPAP